MARSRKAMGKDAAGSVPARATQSGAREDSSSSGLDASAAQLRGEQDASLGLLNSVVSPAPPSAKVVTGKQAQSVTSEQEDDEETPASTSATRDLKRGRGRPRKSTEVSLGSNIAVKRKSLASAPEPDDAPPPPKRSARLAGHPKAQYAFGPKRPIPTTGSPASSADPPVLDQGFRGSTSGRLKRPSGALDRSAGPNKPSAARKKPSTAPAVPEEDESAVRPRGTKTSQRTSNQAIANLREPKSADAPRQKRSLRAPSGPPTKKASSSAAKASSRRARAASPLFEPDASARKSPIHGSDFSESQAGEADAPEDDVESSYSSLISDVENGAHCDDDPPTHVHQPFAISQRDWHGHGIQLREAYKTIKSKLKCEAPKQGIAAQIAEGIKRLRRGLKTGDGRDHGESGTLENLPNELSRELDTITARIDDWITSTKNTDRKTAKRTVKQMLTSSVPRFTSALVILLLCFGTKRTFSIPQLDTITVITSRIAAMELHVEHLRKSHGSFKLKYHGSPLLDPNISVLSRVRPAHKSFSLALNRARAEVSSQRQLRAMQAEREIQEALDAADEARNAILDHWRQKWRDLHNLRRRADGLWTNEDKIKHLGDIPVDHVAREPPAAPIWEIAAAQARRGVTAADTMNGATHRNVADMDDGPDHASRSSSASEVDAHGTPIKRVSVFGARRTPHPPPASAAPIALPYSGPKWDPKERGKLLGTLKEKAGPDVWKEVIWRHCRPAQARSADGRRTVIRDGVLGKYNVREIVEMGVWQKDAAGLHAVRMGEPVEGWVWKVEDPRIWPDLEGVGSGGS